jgi:hypothetical protein
MRKMIQARIEVDDDVTNHKRRPALFGAIDEWQPELSGRNS